VSDFENIGGIVQSPVTEFAQVGKLQTAFAVQIISQKITIILYKKCIDNHIKGDIISVK